MVSHPTWSISPTGFFISLKAAIANHTPVSQRVSILLWSLVPRSDPLGLVPLAPAKPQRAWPKDVTCYNEAA